VEEQSTDFLQSHLDRCCGREDCFLERRCRHTLSESTGWSQLTPVHLLICSWYVNN